MVRVGQVMRRFGTTSGMGTGHLPVTTYSRGKRLLLKAIGSKQSESLLITEVTSPLIPRELAWRWRKASTLFAGSFRFPSFADID